MVIKKSLYALYCSRKFKCDLHLVIKQLAKQNHLNMNLHQTPELKRKVHILVVKERTLKKIVENDPLFFALCVPHTDYIMNKRKRVFTMLKSASAKTGAMKYSACKSQPEEVIICIQ